MYGSAELDALISNTGVASGALNFCLDIGNDGACDYTYDATGRWLLERKSPGRRPVGYTYTDQGDHQILAGQRAMQGTRIPPS